MLNFIALRIWNTVF